MIPVAAGPRGIVSLSTTIADPPVGREMGVLSIVMTLAGESLCPSSVRASGLGLGFEDAASELIGIILEPIGTTVTLGSTAIVSPLATIADPPVGREIGVSSTVTMPPGVKV